MLSFTESPEFRSLSKEERLRWHQKRVAREAPVFDFFDSITSEYDEDGKREALRRVQDKIRAVDNMVSLLRDVAFRSARLNHSMTVAMYNTHRANRSKFLSKVLTNGTVLIGDNEYARLEQHELNAANALDRLEQRIIEKCASYSVPPDQFLSVRPTKNVNVCAGITRRGS